MKCTRCARTTNDPHADRWSSLLRDGSSITPEPVCPKHAALLRTGRDWVRNEKGDLEAQVVEQLVLSSLVRF